MAVGYFRDLQYFGALTHDCRVILTHLFVTVDNVRVVQLPECVTK